MRVPVWILAATALLLGSGWAQDPEAPALEQALSTLEKVLRSPAAQDPGGDGPAGAEEALEALDHLAGTEPGRPRPEAVSWLDGEARRLLTSDAEPVRGQPRAARRVDQVRRGLFPPPGEPADWSGPDLQQSLRGILAEPSYQRQEREEAQRGSGSDAQGPDDGLARGGEPARRGTRRVGYEGRLDRAPVRREGGAWWERWVRGWPSLSGGGASVSVVGQILLVLVILGVTVLACVLVTRWLLERRERARRVAAKGARPGKPDDPVLEGMTDPLAAEPEEWSVSAARLARQGRYRDAIRTLYLELLSRLHRAGLLAYDRTRTNWEYLISLRGRPEVAGPFREFTRTFDEVWYGHQEAQREDYDRCRDHVRAAMGQGEG